MFIDSQLDTEYNIDYMIKNKFISLVSLLFSSLALSILVVPESTSAIVVIPILVLLFVSIIIDEKRKK